MIETAQLGEIREALQMRMLVELMGNAMGKELVLKGGMAMRAIYGSVRYTKDIDLDADLSHSVAKVQGIVRRSLARAVKSGLIEDPVISEPKQTETTLRWKVGGFAPGTPHINNNHINLTIEISRRKKLEGGHIIELPITLSGHGDCAPCSVHTQGVKVQVVDAQWLAMTKVCALMSANRQAVRDIFDLSILIRAEAPSPAPLLSNLPDAERRLQEMLDTLWQKIESMPFADFQTNLAPFLPESAASSISQENYDEMRIDVATQVELWLSDALKASQRAKSAGKAFDTALGSDKPAHANKTRKHI